MENNIFQRDWCIGDIHGEYDKLRKLISLMSEHDRLIFIGDYIDKGTQGRQVVDFLIDLRLRRTCVFLCGNHEFKLLQARKGDELAAKFLKDYGFKKTLTSYGFKNGLDDFNQYQRFIYSLPTEHLDFFSKTRMYYMHPDRTHLIVHAGIDPDFPDSKPLSQHNPETLVFIREKFLSNPKTYHNRTVIFGHIAAKFPIIGLRRIGIDTGACYPSLGTLTAYCLNERKFIDHKGNITLLGEINTIPDLPKGIQVCHGSPYPQ